MSRPAVVERYLEALAARDPSRLPVADGVRFTENGIPLPLGTGLWQDTELRLPNPTPGRPYRNVLTGETLTVAKNSGEPGLRISEALALFPVALLEQVAVYSNECSG